MMGRINAQIVWDLDIYKWHLNMCKWSSAITAAKQAIQILLHIHHLSLVLHGRIEE